MNTTIQNENFHEAEQIMYLCKDLGFDELFYQVQLTGWGKKDWEIDNSKKDINYDDKKNNEFFKEIVKKGKEINFIVKDVDLNKSLSMKNIHFKINSKNLISATYEKNSLDFGEIINYLNQNEIKIEDISTEDGDLEDVFVQLTKH